MDRWFSGKDIESPKWLTKELQKETSALWGAFLSAGGSRIQGVPDDGTRAPKGYDLRLPRTSAADDPYFIALMTMVMLQTGHAKEGQFLAQLLMNHSSEGRLLKASTSITSSGGDSLTIETTALGILAWCEASRSTHHSTKENIETYMMHATRSTRWLMTQSNDAKFGSTQGTVLALKAITVLDVLQGSLVKSRLEHLVGSAGDSLHATISRENHILASAPLMSPDLLRDFSKSGMALRPIVVSSPSLTAAVTESKGSVPPFQIELTFGKQLRSDSGANQFPAEEMDQSSGVFLPWTLSVKFATQSGDESPDSPLRIRTQLPSSPVREGDSVALEVRVSVKPDVLERYATGVPMVTAEVAIPGGLVPRAEQLSELLRSGAVDMVEQYREMVRLYWRGMATGSEKKVTLSLIGHVPGTFQGSASRAFPFYEDSLAAWAPPLSVTIGTD